MTDEVELAELRAENARLKASLAAKQQDINALQMWGADRIPHATLHASQYGYGVLDAIRRGRPAPLDDHGEGEG